MSNKRKSLEKFITSNSKNDLRLFFRLSLFLLLGLAGLFLWHPSAQMQGTGIRLADSTQNVAPASTPVPYFQVTWTAEASSFKSESTSGGQTVMRRQIVMSGSTVVRKLDDMPFPFGKQDNFPFDVTISDDFDRDTRGVACNPVRPVREHHYWSVTSPRRWADGFTEPIIISDPFLIDGEWHILDPFQTASSMSLLDNPVFYNNRIDITGCNGSINERNDGDTVFWAVPLNFPSEDGFIKGDKEGNVFEVTREFTPPEDPTPDTITKWTFTARRLLDNDLTVKRLEVTQALQDGSNSIPIVEGRRTVVRAFLDVGREQAPMERVTGALTGYSGGAELGTVRPFNPGGRITARPEPNWLQIDHTLNFEVPLEWTMQPSLRFEVEVNDDHSVFEVDYENNKLSKTVKSVDCQGFSIAYVPVHYTPPEGYAPADPSPNIANGHEFMRKIFPIPEKELKYFPWSAEPWAKSLTTSGPELLNALESRLRMGNGPASSIFGWTPLLASALNGLGNRPGRAAWGNDTEAPNRWRRTFAHEIGHNLDLDHNERTTAGRHWFDVYERKIKPPGAGGELLDVMVPDRTEPEAWVSMSTYLHLIRAKCVAGGQGGSPPPPSAPASDNLIIGGTINNLTPTTGTLAPLYRTTTAPAYIPPVGTPYCVKLKNAADAVLSQHCFSVGFEGDSATPAASMPFGMVVPFLAALSKVELTSGTTVLNSRIASANPPAVTLTFPNAAALSLGGVQNILWTGSDPDGGPLTYNLLYSRDSGATWTGIASGVTGSSYSLDFSSLPGGTGGLIKVMVSDGFRSAEDVSDNPFSVGNKPPTAAIVSPLTGASFPVNTKVTLQGIGADLEDGSLGDAAFTWSSDRDGALGTGQILETNLSTGTHTITLTVRDSGGLTRIATITSNAASITTISTPTPTPTPTPTFVEVSGRAFTPSGLGLKNAIVAITDSLGVRQTATTSSFGSYRFEAVQTGGTYVISVASKRYRFASRIVPVTGTLSDFDFFGLE